MEMHADDGQVHTVVGEYREVRRPERIAYTWTWESNADAMSGSSDTLVEVEFAEDGDGTLVTITHSGFRGAEVAGMHEHGWTGTLAQLDAFLNA
jgi:uncharacterized protein YndB with AHSA1/START domain